MKFYRLSLYHEHGVSAGFGYFTNRREAEKAFREYMQPPYIASREGTKIEQIEVQPTRAGILRALIRYASDPDNG